jgi:hypothetical protein
MRITRSRTVITGIIAVSALALVAGCSSSSTAPKTTTPASTKPAATAPAATTPASTTGLETLTGHISGSKVLVSTPVVPLTYTGPVGTTGTFSLGNGSSPVKGQHRAFKTGDGTLEAVVTSVPETGNGAPAVIDPAVCEVRSTTIVDFKVPRSAKDTGAFKDVTGKDGQVVVLFQGDMPRLKDGKCNLSQNANPSAATAYLSFTGHVTLVFPAKKS